MAGHESALYGFLLVGAVTTQRRDEDLFGGTIKQRQIPVLTDISWFSPELF